MYPKHYNDVDGGDNVFMMLYLSFDNVDMYCIRIIKMSFMINILLY